MFITYYVSLFYFCADAIYLFISIISHICQTKIWQWLSLECEQLMTMKIEICGMNRWTEDNEIKLHIKSRNEKYLKKNGSYFSGGVNLHGTNWTCYHWFVWLFIPKSLCVYAQICIYLFWNILMWFVWSCHQHREQEKLHSSARYGSSSRKALISSNKPSSSADHSDSRTGRLTSNSSRPSTRALYEGRQSSFTRNTAVRGNRDDILRSLELLSIRK